MAERKGRKPSVRYNVHPYPMYDCPRCDCGLAWSRTYRCKFCPECGQKINWEGFPPEKCERFPSFNGPYDWRIMDKKLKEGVDPLKMYGINPMTGELSDCAKDNLRRDGRL